MPSSHAQFMGFIGIYAVCMLLLRHRASGQDDKIQRWRDILHAVRAASVVLVSVAVCLSRIYLAYHTTKQVLVGAVIGLIFGGLWFALYEVLKQAGVVAWLVDTQIAAIFLMRDTEYEMEVEEEWTRWQARRRSRKKAQ
jgi:dolichyldiphosphatase